MDRTFVEWCCGHGLHGDPVCFDDGSDSGFVCVGESVHDYGSHQWHGVHVHGDCDERVGYGFSIVGFGLGDAVDGSWGTNVGVGDQ